MKQISGSPVCNRFPPLSAKYPWLVAQCLEGEGHNIEDQFFYTIHNDLPHYQCRIPELLGKRIRGYFHGWVILSNHPYNNNWSLWNQLTSEIISLPTLILIDGEYESIGECCLSAPPDDPSSILLLTSTNESNFLFCQVDSKRKKFRWDKISYACELKRRTSNGKLVHSLTCCNGKVYALSTDGTFAHFILQVDIIVNYNEVVIKLMIFGSCPFPSSGRCGGDIQYLKGSATELFYIDIYFERETEKVPADVYLFKTDMTCINWEERVWFKDWDITNIRYPGCDNLEGTSSEDSNTRSEDSETSSEILDMLDMSYEIWEEINDLKDAIFFIDLARDRLVSYSHVIASELGGFIHIRGEMGETIYAFHVKNDTISVYHIPFPMLPTSHVSMWEHRLEDDHGKAKCILDSIEEMENNNEILLRSSTDDGDEFKESHLLNISFHLLEMIMELCVGVEYMNFRATCKQCLLAAPLIKWSNETSLMRLHTYSLASPWLMVVNRKRGNMTFTNPMLGENYYLKNSKVLIHESEKICCSRFGWLLFNKKDLNCLVFFNPFTNDLQELPKAENSLGSLCFSAPPTSLDCMVVGFTRERVYIHFVNQETKWRTLSLATEPHSVCFSSFYGRDLYALCKQGKLIVMDNLGTEDYAWKLVEAEDPKSYCESPSQYFFTKCDQHCLLVGVGEYGKVIKVFKCNESKQAWEKVDSVGKHVIYICGTTCLCIEAKDPKMENKIFFPRLHAYQEQEGSVLFT